jgi:hypothetical protein
MFQHIPEFLQQRRGGDCFALWKSRRSGDRFGEFEMIDRQKVETILRKRFKSANWAEVAAAANAIMGLGDEWLEIECPDATCVAHELEAGAAIRVFRRAMHEEAR